MGERINTVKIKTEVDYQNSKKQVEAFKKKLEDINTTEEERISIQKIIDKNLAEQAKWLNKVRKAQDRATDGIKEYGDVLQRASGKRAMVSNFADSFNDIVASSENAAGAIRNVGSVATEIGFTIGGVFGPIGLAIGGITSALVIAGEQWDIFGTKAEEARKKVEEETSKEKKRIEDLFSNNVISLESVDKAMQSVKLDEYKERIKNASAEYLELLRIATKYEGLQKGDIAKKDAERKKEYIDSQLEAYKKLNEEINNTPPPNDDEIKIPQFVTPKSIEKFWGSFFESDQWKLVVDEKIKEFHDYVQEQINQPLKLKSIAKPMVMPSEDKEKQNKELHQQYEEYENIASALASCSAGFGAMANSTGKAASAAVILNGVASALTGTLSILAAVEAIETSTKSSKHWIELIAAVAATSAAVIGTIVAAKNRFSQGGIVSGGASSGDFTMIRANAGEMVLNNKQQSNLFRMINEGATGGKEISVNVSLDSRQISSAINKAKIRNSSMK